jgi:hypothetical protein
MTSKHLNSLVHTSWGEMNDVKKVLLVPQNAKKKSAAT